MDYLCDESTGGCGCRRNLGGGNQSSNFGRLIRSIQKVIGAHRFAAITQVLACLFKGDLPPNLIDPFESDRRQM
jgi:hypothetical protein